MPAAVMHRLLRLLSFSCFAALALGVSGHAAVQDRVVGPVVEGRRIALNRTVAPRATRAADLGEVPASRTIDGMMLRFSLTDAQQAALTQLTEDQQNPASPRFHQWLTPAQFAAQFGLSASDLSRVTAWLTAQGFTVTQVAQSGTFVTFGGTAAQVKQAFGTSLHQVSLEGESHFANLTEPTLPTGIAAVVGNITGLNDFHPRARIRAHSLPSTGVHPNSTATVCTAQNATGACTTTAVQHFLAPGDFSTIYDTASLLANGTTGSGVTIAVMGQVDLATTDVANFRTAAGLSANAPTLKTYGTDPGSPSAACLGSKPPSNCSPSAGDLAESLLDVEWSGAVAPGAQIIFVNSTNVLGTSLVQAIDNNLAPIMSVSYGDCEVNYSDSDRQSYNQVFQQANAQGITVFAPAGDLGATDCDNGVASATQGLTVDFPASSPYVTAVGGTMFNDGTGTYWNATNGANSTSALSYIPEGVWNETAANLASGGGFGATGGGASAYFAKPRWQTGSGVPNDFARDVPDVSLNAASLHDGYLYCFGGSCSNGTFFPAAGSNGLSNFNYAGGTSFAAPSFAALTALVEQKLGGGRLGNINPNIYALANGTLYNNIFHDVQTGNNNSPCTVGSTNCPAGGTIGYSAGVGYDLATGWGSVDAAVLVNSWSTVTPTVAGGQAVSITTLTGTATPVVAGTAVTLTAKVASGTTSATGTPSGTVQFLLDGKAVASSTVTLASGVATYSLATTGLVSGQHVVKTFYAGDGTFNTSIGSGNLDITSPSVADFSLTPSAATITVTSGSSSPGTTFTVTPLNGFVGTIAFTSTGSINANYSVTPSTVTITSSTTTASVSYAIQTLITSLRQGGAATGLRLKTASIDAKPFRGKGAPWYVAGSGSALAGLLLLTVPRRRQLGSLLAVLVSAAALGSLGCGSSSSTTTTTGPTTTRTAPGTYTVMLTATGTSTGGAVVVHTATVTVVVQ